MSSNLLTSKCKKVFTLVNRKRSVTLSSPLEFVTWMRKHDIQQWDTNAEFMEAYAHRKAVFEKIILRNTSEEAFTEDLQANGLLRIAPKPTLWQMISGQHKHEPRIA